ncbi:MAG: DUF1574 family protein, partial [Spirochaetia bacterium]|nr:DUF1574 family protein [Spirochaetia bacterium]
PEKLQKDTERIVKLYLGNFSIAQEEIYFYRKTLVRLRQAGVRTIVFWPRVNPYLVRAYEDEPRIRQLWKYLSDIAREEGALALDLNYEKEAFCSQYYDASHLSVNCFRTIAPFILRRMEAGW